MQPFTKYSSTDLIMCVNVLNFYNEEHINIIAG